MIYSRLFKLFLARIDVEVAHLLASRTLRALTAFAAVRAVLRRHAVADDPSLEVRALGLRFPSPIGVAAGVDKDATWFESLGLLGFGFVEVGTVTARAQPGNPRPRVFRLTRDRALLNKMGFPNPGAEVVAERLRRRSRDVIVGVNVGKSRSAALADAGEDYRATVQRVARYSDYLVINVSSPNTPGLRDMQAIELLRPLVADVRRGLDAAGVEIPLLIKIGPDAADDHLDALADLAMRLALDGIVAVNTTVDRSGLAFSSGLVGSVEGGGISGAPLKDRALEVLRRLRARVGDSLVLISVGGVSSSEDVCERILAGATLVQVYTGFVYGGPAWPRRMNRALAQLVRDSGRSSVQELVGTGTLARYDAREAGAPRGPELASLTPHPPSAGAAVVSA